MGPKFFPLALLLALSGIDVATPGATQAEILFRGIDILETFPQGIERCQLFGRYFGQLNLIEETHDWLLTSI